MRAIDLAEVEAEGFPGTAAEYLDLLAGSGEVEVEADVTSADAGFVYPRQHELGARRARRGTEDDVRRGVGRRARRLAVRLERRITRGAAALATALVAAVGSS